MEDNSAYKLGVKNIMFSVLAQGITFALSIVTGFLLPKAMGVTQYGYWQVYLFYVGYIILLCFGFNDGLYLRYGRLNYSQLPFEKLRSAMRIFMLVSGALACILFGLSFLEKDPNKVFAFCAISINLLILGINGTLLTILQFTNRIKLNSALTIANKAVFVVLIIPLFFLKWVDFRIIIVVDIFTKLLLLSINVYKSKELFLGQAQSIVLGFKEYKQDVDIGIQLMFANIISSLLIGIGRFIVERFMPLESYSLYSFATTITTFALVFITASSLAMYPLLTRVAEDKLPLLYKDLNILLCVGLFLLLAGYYPLYYLIKYSFNDFAGIFEYFYLLFIIIVSQGKMQFLINTYYKVLREEKAMLLANISGAVVALMVIVPAFYYTHSIFAIVAGTTLTLIWRCYASEIYLKKRMGIKGYGNIAAELGMVVLFIVGVISGKPIGLVMYLLAVCVYGFINRAVLWRYSSKIFRLATER